MDSQIYVDLKRELETVFDCPQIFKQARSCISYLYSIKSCKTLFIISHECALRVLPIVEKEKPPQTHYIYIFCQSELEKASWNCTNLEEFRGCFTSKDELMQKLNDDINMIKANTETTQTSTTSPITQDITNERIANAVPSISVFNNKSINNSIKHLNEDSKWFIRYQLLFEILIKLEKSSTAVEDMIYVCKQFYSNNKKRLEQIDEFEKDAENTFKSIYWYTKESFIVHLLNKACGSDNIDEIYPFRLFITNLHHEIVNLDNIRRGTILKCQTILFRGKPLAVSTLEKLKNNKNRLVAMNGFLSTTSNEQVAKCFTGVGGLRSDQRAVLFKLNIDPNIRNKPHANIPPDRHAMGANEQEHLFSIGSVWRIIDVKELKDDAK